MIGPTHADDRPWAVVKAMAELADQLRLCVGEEPSAAAPAWQGRLLASGRWWRRAGVESGLGGCAELAAALESAAAALGVGAAPDPALQIRLLQLDSELTVLARDYDTGCLDPERCLPELRLEAPAAAAIPAEPADEPVVLLVASPFLREVLASRLAEAGRRVLAAASPAEVPALLAGPRPPQLILCDNEEPTGHLRRLRRLLAGAPAPLPALVLVASGAGAPPGGQRRARAAGADGIWVEPWPAERLPLVRAAGGNA